MLRLAGPVVLAEIGWMSMGIVDTIMVGPLGPAAIGASGLSNSLFFAIAKRATRARAALIATGVLALSYATDVPLRWASGSQDLLALMFGLDS